MQLFLKFQINFLCTLVIHYSTMYLLYSKTKPNDETQSLPVHKVPVNLPPFWPDQPVISFAQAEAHFKLAATKCQRTEFTYVVSQLNQQQGALEEDFITSPPEHEPYDRLKAERVQRLSTSREQRVKQLLSHEEKGDRKPSQFLRHLRGLAPDVTDDFLRPIWASRLPPHIQANLADQTEGSLDLAAQLADEFCEVTPQPTKASVSPAAPDNTARLEERIEEPSRLVESLAASQRHSRSQSGDHRYSNPKTSPTPHDVCWYHWRFGDNAWKCTPPCSRQHRYFHQQGNSTSRR